MYYYLIDPKGYRGKRFEYDQTRLLSLVTEYHVAGEVARATPLRTVEDLALTALSHGVKTLVVIGGDETFTKVLRVVYGKSITLGFIPLDPESEVAQVFGIGESAEDAVGVIAKRLVEPVDVVRVGTEFFISAVRFDTTYGCELMVDESYRISADGIGGKIINAQVVPINSSTPQKLVADAKDRKIELVLAGKLSRLQSWRYRKFIEAHVYESLPGSTVLHAQHIAILSPEGMPVYVGQTAIAKAPVDVVVTDYSLRCVVGRNRRF